MRWKILKDRNTFSVRRWNNGKLERLPSSQYSDIRDNIDDLDKFVKRLNAPYEAKIKVEFSHAFINDSLLADYFNYLSSQIPTQSFAKTEFAYLKNYALTFFISELHLNRVEEWYAVHETKWAKYLLSKKVPKSVKTKRDIVNALNRFVVWLHKKRPTEITLVKFQPISPAKFKEVNALRILNKEVRETKLIAAEDWKKIHLSASPTILPFIMLAYHYGLRRSETLGCVPGIIKNGYLEVNQQLRQLGVYAPLKGRLSRKVPHWFAKPGDAFMWVSNAQTNVMHPSTLTHTWNDLMERLGMDYDFHDLRHSFITHAMRAHPPRDVQLAAGHQNIQTTMKYLHDDRTLDDEEFIPNKAS
jgi:integrase